jgi:hypothetical protein
MLVWLRTALGTASVIAVAAAGAAGEPRYQHASFTLTEKRPAHATGERFVIRYVNPRDPHAKPAPERHVTATLPRGARIDTTAPAPCTASNAELVARGGAACPPASRVGRGTGVVDTGFPGPGRTVAADVAVFNTRGGFLTVNTARDVRYRNVFRFRVRGRTWSTTTPRLPGTPPDGGALALVDIHIFKRHGYLTTPRRCPRRRYWVTTMRFSYDGGGTQTDMTRTPCKRGR